MKTVSFVGTVDARGELTLVSPLISHPYYLKRIRAKFAEGCKNQMKLRFFHSSDNEAPSTGEPSGISVLADYGQVDYIVGNSDAKDMLHEVEFPEGNSFLKVYAVNDEYHKHVVDVQMYIEPIIRR